MESLDGSHNGEICGNRLHADVQKAVGGGLNLIRELARVSYHLDPSVHPDWLVKRIKFFAYELQSQLDSTHTNRERLNRLNTFFFTQKKFRCLTELSSLAEPSEAFALNHVLAHRAGSPNVLALIYSYLAEKIGVQLEFVDLKPACFLKWSDHGRSRFIDIIRTGTTLSSDELIGMLHTRFEMTSLNNTSLLETYPFESYLTDYLLDLKTSLAPQDDPEKLLFLQNILVAYQPSNLQLLAERAVLNRRVGHFKSALSDLKRFFVFYDREKAPLELVQLHDDLVQVLERQKSNMEVLD